jgi:hypothetical protein
MQSPIPPHLTSTGHDTPEYWYLNVYSRALWSLPITAVLIVFILIVMIRPYAQDPVENLKKSRAELAALAPPPLKDEDNAAVAIMKAMAGYTPFSGKRDDDPDVLLNMPGSRFENASVKSYFQANAPVIQQLHDALQLPQCNWNCDYTAEWGMMAPHTRQVRCIARLLAGSARMHAHAADHAEAARCIAAVYRLARLVAQDAEMNAQKTAFSSASTADNAIASILAYDPPGTESEFALYREALWSDRLIRSNVANALRFERLVWLRELDIRAIKSTPNDTIYGRFAVPEGLYDLTYGSERATVDATYSDVIAETSEHGVPDWYGYRASIKRNQKGPSILGEYLIISFQNVFDGSQENQERANRLQCAVAVKAYQLKYQRDPTSLSDVVPEFFTQLPNSVRSAGGFNIVKTIDNKGSDIPIRKFFEGKPVLKVYSFRDGRDDGGKDSYDVIRLAPVSNDALQEAP